MPIRYQTTKGLSITADSLAQAEAIAAEYGMGQIVGKGEPAPSWREDQRIMWNPSTLNGRKAGKKGNYRRMVRHCNRINP